MMPRRTITSKNLKRKAKDANLKDHQGQGRLSAAGPSTGDSIHVAAPSSGFYSQDGDRPGHDQLGDNQVGDSQVGKLDTQTIQANLVHEQEGDGQGRLLACPFYKLNPRKHSACSKYKLRRIKDVKDHLKRRHFPDDDIPYCPKCLTKFAKGEHPAADRDEHIRTCKQSSSQTQGTQETQETEETEETREHEPKKQSKWGRAERGAGLVVQWNHLYTVTFPGEPLPSSPFMTDVREEARDELRRYWEKKAPEIIQRALRNAGGFVDREWARSFGEHLMAGVLSHAIAVSPDNPDNPDMLTVTEEAGARDEPGDPYYGLKPVATDTYGLDTSVPGVSDAPVHVLHVPNTEQATPSGDTARPPDIPTLASDKNMTSWHGDQTAHQRNVPAFYPFQMAQDNTGDDRANIHQPPRHELNPPGDTANAPARTWRPPQGLPLDFGNMEFDLGHERQVNIGNDDDDDDDDDDSKANANTTNLTFHQYEFSLPEGDCTSLKTGNWPATCSPPLGSPSLVFETQTTTMTTTMTQTTTGEDAAISGNERFPTFTDVFDKPTMSFQEMLERPSP